MEETSFKKGFPKIHHELQVFHQALTVFTARQPQTDHSSSLSFTNGVESWVAECTPFMAGGLALTVFQTTSCYVLTIRKHFDGTSTVDLSFRMRKDSTAPYTHSKMTATPQCIQVGKWVYDSKTKRYTQNLSDSDEEDSSSGDNDVDDDTEADTKCDDEFVEELPSFLLQKNPPPRWGTRSDWGNRVVV